ncbi:unnamed protein product [Gadus morhua 'NCC']
MVLTPCDLTFVDSWPGQSVQLAAAALPGPVARDYGDVFQLGSGLHISQHPLLNSPAPLYIGAFAPAESVLIKAPDERLSSMRGCWCLPQVPSVYGGAGAPPLPLI